MALHTKLARMVRGLRCLIKRHEPNRRRVRKRSSGMHCGYCRFCGAKIRRKNYNHWVREEWPEQDGDD